MVYIPRQEPRINFREITDRLNVGREECGKAGYHIGEIQVEPLFRDGHYITVYECRHCGDAYLAPTRTQVTV